MKIRYSSLFKKKVQAMKPEMKKRLKMKLSLLIDDPKHPSLRTKKIKGTDGIFELSVTMAVRLTFEYTESGDLLLRNIGEHDATLKNP